jgi:hypothetical protein
MLVPWMLMVNKRLRRSSHADLPSRIKCLDGLQPGRQAQHGESGKGHIHIAASSVKPLRRSTPAIRDWDLKRSHQVPEQVLVPATVPSQTHRQRLVPVPLRPYTAAVNVGTWNVRGLSARNVHKPVDVSLTLTSKDITVCAIQETAGPTVRHDPGFSYVGNRWVRN